MIDLKIEVPQKRALRYMGYPARATPSARVQQVFDRSWPEALDLLEPRGAFALIDEREALAAKMPRPTARVAVGLCTVGPALEQRARQLSEAKKSLDALILDAVGSAAAEAAADALNHRLCAEVRREGLFGRARVSPGYGVWPLQGQRRLLALLPADQLGVRLTEGMMMIPRKSVSFALRLDAAAGNEEQGRKRCARCSMRDCEYRM